MSSIEQGYVSVNSHFINKLNIFNIYGKSEFISFNELRPLGKFVSFL